ncbi:MAG TPA: hypothetical protein PLQ52_13305, partial [Lacunisphaera sp.]|nr:hypothetical protein [Lacunisphaera sp.]
MFTILGADGKEYGPVPTAKIHEWINGGRANLTTKAKHADEGVWKALGEFAEFSAPPTAATAADTSPAAAMPAAAPIQPSGAVDAKAYAADLIARAAPLDIFG